MLHQGRIRTFRGPGTYRLSSPVLGALIGGSAGAIIGGPATGSGTLGGPRERFVICPADQRCPR